MFKCSRFAELCDIYKFDSFCLEDILQNHLAIATEITKHIKPLMHFKEYLQYGAYPFILEDKDSYHQKIVQMINLILETDLSLYKQYRYFSNSKTKKTSLFIGYRMCHLFQILQILQKLQIYHDQKYMII